MKWYNGMAHGILLILGGRDLVSKLDYGLIEFALQFCLNAVIFILLVSVNFDCLLFFCRCLVLCCKGQNIRCLLMASHNPHKNISGKLCFVSVVMYDHYFI